MKKIISMMLIALLTVFNFTTINSVAATTNLDPYLNIIEKVNEKYGTQYYILEESEYYNSLLYKDLNLNYEQYILNIAKYDLNEFETTLVNSANNGDEVINVKIENTGRSTLGTKTKYFNNNINKMTLTYKYSGGKYDTSYKPGVSVTRVSNINYFEMTSHTGSFKNSNSTYSVVAYGRIITPVGVANNKSFTVNFSL